MLKLLPFLGVVFLTSNIICEKKLHDRRKDKYPTSTVTERIHNPKEAYA
jgi:hypothetical protein